MQSDINVTPLIDVLLVLLIIFIVIMPIMVKSEALDVPREADPGSVSELVPLTVTIKNDLGVVFNDGDRDTAIPANELARTLRPKLATLREKVVFVDFETGVPWREVVATMDSVRGLADDSSHDEIKVALKLTDH
jgi:biopolymer transport protein ExbD